MQQKMISISSTKCVCTTKHRTGSIPVKRLYIHVTQGTSILFHPRRLIILGGGGGGYSAFHKKGHVWFMYRKKEERERERWGGGLASIAFLSRIIQYFKRREQFLNEYNIHTNDLIILSIF